ncbi:MAG: hypothetical protein HOA17_00080 [Candidatus Melainabacteria bacterium]|jgi:hypothetical protein|nr:hypothetical protein [Candidatus Melainabacteria bacterium]
MMARTSTTAIDFTELRLLPGLDGFVHFDPEGDVIQAKLENNSQILDLRKTLTNIINSQEPLAAITSRLMLTDKGVMQVLSFGTSYLIVLAGHKSPVDVTKLTTITDALIQMPH